MPKMTHIQRRRGSKNYEVRIRVPEDIRHIVQKNERVKSLGTSDAREAKKLGLAVIMQWEQEFDEVRARRNMTMHDIHAATVEHYQAQLRRDDQVRLNRPTAAEVEEARVAVVQRALAGEFDVENPLATLDASLEYQVLRNQARLDSERRKVLFDAMKRQVAEGQTDLIRYAAAEFISRNNLTIEADSALFRQLCHHLARGEIEFLKRTFERDEGDYTGTPVDAILVEKGLATLNKTTFEDIIAEQERLSNLGVGASKAASTLRKYRATMKSFAAWRKSPRAATVTLEEAERWRDELLTTGSRKTARDKIGCLRSVCQWGHKQSNGKLYPNGFVLENLILPTVEVSESAKRTYSLEDAKKLLAAARGKSEPHFRWAPWLAAYTGARISELMQLTKADLHKVGDDWFCHVQHDPTNGRTTKTKKSRKFPLHPALVKEGFVDFVRSAPAGPLFPAPRAEGNLRDWIREEVFKDFQGDRPAPNHGFRHLFEDLRFGKVSREAAYYITGRKDPGSAALYGKSDAMLPALAEEMKKFPTIL